MTTVFKAIDDLSAAWAALEKVIATLPVEYPQCSLTVTRVGGRMRLCYCGAPVGDLSAADKVKATSHLPLFYEVVKNSRENTRIETERATSVVEKHTIKLSELEGAK